MMKTYLKGIVSAFAVGLAVVAAQAVVPIYTGFTVRQQGYVIQAQDWNNEFQNLIAFINTNCINSFNLITTGKGYLLSSDGVNLQPITNNGSADNGKVLTLDSTQSPGAKWATLVSGIAALTTLGDTVVQGPTGLTRLPVGANGQVLTADSTQPNGVAYEAGVPAGAIIMWPNSSFPTGWYLCNGQTMPDGLVTPNLQGLFPFGAGNTSPAAANGYGLIPSGTAVGATTHAHTFDVVSGTAGAFVSATQTSGGVPLSLANHVHEVSGTTTVASSAPAGYALYFIEKN